MPKAKLKAATNGKVRKKKGPAYELEEPTEVEEEIPIAEVVQENEGGREDSLPDILGGKTESEKEEPPQGFRHASPNDDSMVSLEEYEAIKEILNPGRNEAELDARTEVNTLQVIHFSRGRVIAKRFGIRYLDQYVTSIERLMLSHKRKSRMEHVKAISGLVQQNDQAQSMLGKLF